MYLEISCHFLSHSEGKLIIGSFKKWRKLDYLGENHCLIPCHWQLSCMPFKQDLNPGERQQEGVGLSFFDQVSIFFSSC